MPLSLAPLRQRAYRLSVGSHAALAILSIAACLLRIVCRHEWQCRYPTRVWVALVMTLGSFSVATIRLGHHGAFITVIDSDYHLARPTASHLYVPPAWCFRMDTPRYHPLTPQAFTLVPTAWACPLSQAQGRRRHSIT